MTDIAKMKKIVESLGEKFTYNKDYWAIVDSEETQTVVGTDGYLHIVVSTDEDVYKKPRFLQTMYQQFWDKIQKGTFKAVDEFAKNVAKRLKQHTKLPEIDILMEEQLEDVHIIVYTDDLMNHALAEVKRRKK